MSLTELKKGINKVDWLAVSGFVFIVSLGLLVVLALDTYTPISAIQNWFDKPIDHLDIGDVLMIFLILSWLSFNVKVKSEK